MALNSVYDSFLWTCVITFLLLYSTTGKTKMYGTITILFLLILAIFLISIDVLKGINTSENINNSFTIIYYILPLLLIVLPIIFLIYILIKHSGRIINNQVSNNYYYFSNISMFLIFIQTIIVFKSLHSKNSESKGGLSKLSNSVLYLFSLLNITSLIILYSVLTYFTANG